MDVVGLPRASTSGTSFRELMLWFGECCFCTQRLVAPKLSRRHGNGGTAGWYLLLLEETEDERGNDPDTDPTLATDTGRSLGGAPYPMLLVERGGSSVVSVSHPLTRSSTPWRVRGRGMSRGGSRSRGGGCGKSLKRGVGTRRGVLTGEERAACPSAMRPWTRCAMAASLALVSSSVSLASLPKMGSSVVLDVGERASVRPVNPVIPLVSEPGDMGWSDTGVMGALTARSSAMVGRLARRRRREADPGDEWYRFLGEVEDPTEPAYLRLGVASACDRGEVGKGSGGRGSEGSDTSSNSSSGGGSCGSASFCTMLPHPPVHILYAVLGLV
jgi:hypothetical protein